VIEQSHERIVRYHLKEIPVGKVVMNGGAALTVLLGALPLARRL